MNILFVCVENANRSQMAEAFAKIHGASKVNAMSAGSKPSHQINPKATLMMAEKGYDLTKHQSKSLKEIPPGMEFDYVITMGCGDACPWVPAKHREDWAIPDPKNMNEEEFRVIRDLIESKVRKLLGFDQ